MKLPKFFKIFGQKVIVEYADLEPTIGGLSHAKGLIQINNKLPRCLVKQVLLHEFFHSVIGRTSLDQRISIDLEEILVEMLSKALVENFDIKVKKV
jgi:hypothetical protein